MIRVHSIINYQFCELRRLAQQGVETKTYQDMSQDESAHKM